MTKSQKITFALLLFNSVSAIGGGIALMTGAIDQPQWVAQTGFTSLFFPGVILAAIVGGSSLIAALAVLKNAIGWQLASILAGVIMLFWIGLEIVSIREFHALQVIYFATGLAIVWFVPRSK